MRNPVAAGLSDNLEDGTIKNDVAITRNHEDAGVLQMARQCLADSESYLDASHRRQIEKNIANYQSRHPAGSKYHTASYKARNKKFQPKTKAMGLRRDAAVSAAFFSTSDVTAVEAVNQDDKQQAAAAALYHKIMERRLSMNGSVKWFQTVIGASQDAFVQGVCVSCQYWDYEVDADGDVVKDTPAVRLIPIENFRYSPAADWRDPVGDSPYLFEVMPMTVGKITDKMIKEEWAMAEASTIAASTRPYDSTTAAREHNEASSKEADTVQSHQIGYVYRVIVREEGVDWVFYMLGNGEHLLTQPTKLKDTQPNGKSTRNYVLGTMSIESHKSVGQSPVEMLESLQANINDIVNSRQDNIALALNKRFFVRRKGRVDLPALLRNVPGGSVMVNEHNDVREMETKDVTASSYKEQEMMNAGFDEIGGGFNPSSVTTNRAMNETVGGMELMASDSNTMTEHAVKQFAITWAGPVLNQLLELEQAYEDDPEMILGAANDSNIAQEQGMTEITDELLRMPVQLTVNIGIDATNPGRAVDKLMGGVSMGMNMGVDIDTDEVFKEIMGKIGYDNGKRFVRQPDPNAPPPPPDPAVVAEEMKAQGEAQKAEIAAQKISQDGEIAMQKMQLEMQKMQMQLDSQMQAKQSELEVRRDIAEEQTETQIGIALMQDKTARETAALQAETAIQSKIVDGEVAIQSQQVQREANQLKDKQASNAVLSKSQETKPASQ